MAKANGRAVAVLGHRYTLVREGLGLLLTNLQFEVFHAASLGETVLAVKDHGPALVLVDQSMLQDDVVDLHVLAACQPDLRIAILARPEPQEDVATFLQAGASGYLSLDLSPEDLERSIRLLMEGDIVVSRDLTSDLQSAMGTPKEEAFDSLLSQREREVLGLVGIGKTNREIAHDLIVTESTVKVHLRSVLDKLNLRNRQQAAAYAAKNGLFPEEVMTAEEKADVAELS